MGVNSTEVAYGFGQMGSGHIKASTALYPPAGRVIVAITSDISPPTMSGFTSTVKNFPIIYFFTFSNDRPPK